MSLPVAGVGGCVCVCVVLCESAIATAMSACCGRALAPLAARSSAAAPSPSVGPRRLAAAVVNNVIGPGSSRRAAGGASSPNVAQPVCRQSCARAPAARLRGGTGPSTGGRDVRRRHRGYIAGPSPGCLGQSQNWRLSLLLLLLVVVLLLVQMLLVVRRGSPTRLDARVAGI